MPACFPKSEHERSKNHLGLDCSKFIVVRENINDFREFYLDFLLFVATTIIHEIIINRRLIVIRCILFLELLLAVLTSQAVPNLKNHDVSCFSSHREKM